MLVGLCYFTFKPHVGGFFCFQIIFLADLHPLQQFNLLLYKVQESETLTSASNHFALVLSVINLVKGIWWQILSYAPIT